MPEPVRVALEGCRCPGSPHTGGDAVLLKPKADVPLIMAAWTELNTHNADEIAVLQGILSRIYMRLGILSWTFTDVAGKAEPITQEAIERLLPPWQGGVAVAQQADELYSEDVFAPLVSMAAERAKSSPPSPTAESTSAGPSSGESAPTPSEPSSPAATAAGTPSEAPAR